MCFSGMILDYAYEVELHSNFYCLHKKPPQFVMVTNLSGTREQKLLKMTAILVLLDQYPELKMTFGI